MNWIDVVAPPKPRILRQFAALWLMFFLGVAAWQAWHGHWGIGTVVAAAVAVLVGAGGLAVPTAIRWIYTACLVVAFPIGWTISQVAIAAIFYLVFTPVALIFRVIRRDALDRRRTSVASYWTRSARPPDARSYFRQG